MNVEHGLAGTGACIEDDPVAGFVDALGGGDLPRLAYQLGGKLGIGRGERGGSRMVSLGDHEHMSRGLRVDVAECDRTQSVADHRRRNLTRDDLAEETIGLCGSHRLIVATPGHDRVAERFGRAKRPMRVIAPRRPGS